MTPGNLHPSQKQTARLLLIAACLSLFAYIGCGGQTQNRHFDSNTNWLSLCTSDASCGDGLECLCGFCTEPCGADSNCSSHGEGAVCALPEELGDSCGASLPSGGLCTLGCEASDQCDTAGSEGTLSCSANLCLPAAPSATDAGLSSREDASAPASTQDAGDNQTESSLAPSDASTNGPSGDLDPTTDSGPASLDEDAGPSCPSGMRLIEGGHFVSLNDPFAEDRNIEPFCLDEAEVSVEAWNACALSGNCTSIDDFGVAVPQDSLTWPVSYVLLAEAEAYCAYRGKRLASRWEFEWSGRNGALAHLYPWGDTTPTVDDDPKRACWNEASPCDSGSFELDTNIWGVSDLGASMSEWVTTDSGGCIAGGSWDSIPLSIGTLLVSSCRIEPPDTRFRSGGVRCAADL